MIYRQNITSIIYGWLFPDRELLRVCLKEQLTSRVTHQTVINVPLSSCSFTKQCWCVWLQYRQSLSTARTKRILWHLSSGHHKGWYQWWHNGCHFFYVDTKVIHFRNSGHFVQYRKSKWEYQKSDSYQIFAKKIWLHLRDNFGRKTCYLLPHDILLAKGTSLHNRKGIIHWIQLPWSVLKGMFTSKSY